ncbi:MAG TPA: carboxypeptidase-like regulatory domain-containing protein, partial [Paludibacter sp.]
MKKILLPLLLFGFRVALSQTGGIISGKISDKQTDETLNDVNVFVKGTNVSTSTNEKGTFVLSNLSTTKIVLVISRVGYETIELPVTVSENKPTVVNLALNIENQVGNEVV